MSAQFEFLGPLKQLVNGTETVEAEGGSVWDALKNLEEQYPGLFSRLLGENDVLQSVTPISSAAE